MPGPLFPRAWLLYAGLLTAAVVVGEVSNFLRGEPFAWLTVANWIVTIALLAATWGHAMQRPIGNETYWRRVFWILVVVTVLMLLRVAIASLGAFVKTVAFMALLVPAYVAAFRYAFRSPHLWREVP